MFFGLEKRIRERGRALQPEYATVIPVDLRGAATLQRSIANFFGRHHCCLQGAECGCPEPETRASDG
jgi:hypothetical protein